MKISPNKKSAKKSISRKKFIKNVGLTGLGVIASTSGLSALNKKSGITIIDKTGNYTPPSDRLNIAAIGAGGKGKQNIINSFLQYTGGDLEGLKGANNIVALCDVDDRRAKEIKDKFSKAPYYQDYREMLDKEHENIDAVIISSPDHMHYVQAIACMELGKGVYLEKPLTHDIWEARQLTEAEKKYKVVTQMGNQGSSGDGIRWSKAIIDEGHLGDILEVHTWTNRPVWPQGVALPTKVETIPEGVNWDLWLGTAPLRGYNEAFMPTRWRGYWDYGTGALGDMGCHIMDSSFFNLELGYPKSISCSFGTVYEDFFKEFIYKHSPPPSSIVHLEFERDGKALEYHWYDGGIRPKVPRDYPLNAELATPAGGSIIVGTKASMISSCYCENPMLFKDGKFLDIQPSQKLNEVPGGASGHQAQWVEACKKGYGAYTSSPFSKAGPLTETVLIGNLATRSGMIGTTKTKEEFDGTIEEVVYEGRRKLLWDAKAMKITNFEPANQFVRRQYRSF